jgi:hypothetical protein
MLQHCAACPEPFRYMRGRIYLLGERDHLEYFWLCENCSVLLDLEQAPNGQVHAVPRLDSAA